MITSQEEYLSNLAQIQLMRESNYYFPIPESEKIYKINLNTRAVEAPAHLSVVGDHESEIIYFEVDRYFDQKDLAQTTCIILYINAAKENLVYAVPCMDITSKDGKIILPWVISSDVTWTAGNIQFAFQFYELDSETLEYIYMLNTKSATTSVLQGLSFGYIEATTQAAADFEAGVWGENNAKTYYIKITNSTGYCRYQVAPAEYSNSLTYYLRAEEEHISSGTSLESIYKRLGQLEKNAASTLKWVEI